MSNEKQKVVWTDAEWDAVLRSVWKARKLDGATTFNLTICTKSETDVRPPELKVAQHDLKFTADRIRFFSAKELLRGPGERALQRIIEQDELRCGPATAYSRAAQVTLTAKAQSKRVFWRETEWRQIVGELIRRDPITMLNSSTLATLSAADVVSAARAIWPDCKVPMLRSMTKIRVLLLKCVVEHKERLVKEERLREEERVNLEVQAAQAAASRVDSPADILMKSFAAETAKQFGPLLGPMIEQHIDRVLMPRVETMLLAMFERITATLSAQLGVKVQAPIQTPVVGKKLHIAVVGLNEEFKFRLQKEFPQYMFTVTGRDPHRVGDTVKNCDLVLCAVDGISHSTTNAALKAAGSKGHRVSGNDSAIIRRIDVWSKTDEQAKRSF